MTMFLAKHAETIGWIVMATVILGVIAAFMLPPYFEATEYTRVTGIEVSYWSAIWLDLRVTGCPQ